MTFTQPVDLIVRGRLVLQVEFDSEASDDEHFPGLSRTLRELEDNQREISRLLARNQVLYRDCVEVGRAADRAAEDPSSGMSVRSIQATIAARLRISERLVESKMSDGFRLTTDYPLTLRALESGLISLDHARIVADEGVILHDPDIRKDYERKITRLALKLSVTRLRPVAKRLAEELAGEPIGARHERAKRRRRVWVTPLEDGMAEFGAILTAVDAYAMKERVNLLASKALRAEKKHADERRSHAEIRADVLTDVVLDRQAHRTLRRDAVQSVVRVTIPYVTLVTPDGGVDPENEAHFGLAGLQGLPELDGYGPIDPETARRLAGGSTVWERVLVHPVTGVVQDVDRYRPSESMRRLLEVRDEQCRFPGCRVRASSCDIDHTVPHARGGKTSRRNLASLCRRHHRLKHHGSWTIRQDDDGVVWWTDPTGQQHGDEPRRWPAPRRPGKAPPF